MYAIYLQTVNGDYSFDSAWKCPCAARRVATTAVKAKKYPAVAEIWKADDNKVRVPRNAWIWGKLHHTIHNGHLS